MAQHLLRFGVRIPGGLRMAPHLSRFGVRISGGLWPRNSPDVVSESPVGYGPASLQIWRQNRRWACAGLVGPESGNVEISCAL